MIPTGLHTSQQASLMALLRAPHTIKIGVRMLDVSHNYVGSLSGSLMDGNVAIDVDGSVADRACDLQFLDPLKKIHLDADSPHPQSVYIASMMSVMYSIAPPDWSTWYDIPVFCGPINNVTRNGVFLSVSCLGKEVLSNDNVWMGRTWKKGLKKTDIIKQILKDAGETKYDIPDLSTRTKADFSYKRDQGHWIQAKRLANGMGYQLFYDGRGVARMRKAPEKINVSIGEDVITTPAQFGYDLSAASNAVQVLGGTPKGAKLRINARLVAPDWHPLSPKRVGRNGVPRYLNPIVIDDTNIRTYADAYDLAQRTLNAALLESTDVTFDMLPNPLLEPMDMGYLATDGYGAQIRLRKFTIPLRNDSDSSVGYFKRTRPKGRPPITKRKRAA